MKKVIFYTTDNLKLTGLWHLPHKPANKVVILAHGITTDKDDAGSFINLYKFLIKNGYAVFRFDFRGSGESEGKSMDMTVAGEIADLSAAVDLVQKAGFKKTFLLAASFGGSIAAFYTASHINFLDGLCLWNPVLNYKHTFIKPTLPWIIDKVGHMRAEIAKQGWTTLGSRKFVIGRQLWNEWKKLKPYQYLNKIKIPTRIIHADTDTYVPFSDSKKYVYNLLKGDLITVKNGEHGFHGEEDGQMEAHQATLEFFDKLASHS